MKCVHHHQHRCTVLIATSSELEPIKQLRKSADHHWKLMH